MSLIRKTAMACLLASIAGCLQSAAQPSPETRTPADQAEQVFLAKPYLQWGREADWSPDGGIEVLWHAEDADSNWSLESRTGPEEAWRPAEAPQERRIAVAGVPPHRVCRAAIKGVSAGAAFSYQVKRRGSVVFSGEGRAPGPVGEPHRFVVFGDCGAGTKEQREIAYRAHELNPNYVMITGDIVYSRGRVAEYREKFWPIYNADRADPAVGAPLLRSTIFLAAPGNHDIATRDLDKYPDALAYFLFWSQPLNGPPGGEGSAHVPPLVGSEEHQRAFRQSAGESYPRMGNFSLNYGNAHWTILDTNPYVNWKDPRLRDWVRQDLAAASGSTWRFVALHQPGFSSARAHADEQNMRRLSDLFQEGGVDVVFCGHVHNYQRTFPLRFEIDPRESSGPPGGKEIILGRWKLDRAFDGATRTRADGVIYVVTGAGGASLYNPEQQDDPSSWQEFTSKFVSRVHSLTVADVQGSKLTVRQLDRAGEELDRFTLTK
ncbi:MAG: metallophosphoesterase [Isosphaeraceae bacterium]